MRPLGIYVQVPFCQTKCTYCNFHTGVVSPSRFAPYVRAVCGEIRHHVALYANAELRVAEALGDLTADSVYMGGGPPSLLDPVHIADLLAAMRGTFAWHAPEITLEADPETIEPDKAAAWIA